MKPPNYTEVELGLWLIEQPEFNKLYKKWLMSKDKWLKPSCDRTDDYLGYDLSRLIIVTWKDNQDKYDQDRIKGINRKTLKSVGKLTMSKELIKEFYSIADASRKTGISEASIGKCCRGSRNEAGGYIWTFL